MLKLNNTLIEMGLENLLEIEKIITIYHNDFAKTYVFEGEQHDFWELVYVDYGEVEVTADGQCFSLKKDDVIFHKPNEFHTIAGDKKNASSVLIISFVCNSKSMSFFNNKIFQINSEQRLLLGKIVSEAKNVFVNELGQLYREEKRLKQPVIGAEQLMYQYLSQLLIFLIRDNRTIAVKRNTGLLRKTFSDEVVNDIIRYLEEHIDTSICLDDICREFYLSKTYLKRFFKEETSYPVMKYLQLLRIEKAKILINEGKENFGTIASRVGFDSVSYFSTCFKKNVGMTPSDYLDSIKKYDV